MLTKQQRMQLQPRHTVPINTSVHEGEAATPTSMQLPERKTLQNDYHIYQSFNNCGPAALSMALSYYGVQVSQEELGQALRPYQVPGGDNDDKSVTLAELAEKSKEYGFIPYHRPNGSIDRIQAFIAHGMPVITRTWLKEDEDIGHFRIVKGYDTTNQIIIQDDSLQGKNLTYSYDAFNKIWVKFNYEYLVLVPKDKEGLVRSILGEDADELTAWRHAEQLSKDLLEKNPDDIDAWFNVSVALYHVGNYEESTKAYEKVADKLPFRMLWYQLEPLLSYYELGQYDTVLRISDGILTYHNRAYSELYMIRGDIYKKQGKLEEAKIEYEKAVYYNKNLQKAKEKLAEQ